MGITVKTQELDAAIRTGGVLGKAGHATTVELSKTDAGALSVVVTSTDGHWYERLCGVLGESSQRERMKVSVALRQLAAVVGVLRGEETDLSFDGRRLSVKSGAARFALPVVSEEATVSRKLCAASELSAQWDRIGPALDRVLPSVSHDESRYVLNGVHFERDGDHLVLVSSDGHRLSLTRVAWPAGDCGLAQDGVIVSAEACRLLRASASPEGRWCIDGGAVHYWDEEQSLVLRLIDGEFPAWRQVLPSDAAQQVVTVASGALSDTVDQARAIGADGIVLDVEPQLLTLSTATLEAGALVVEQPVTTSAETRAKTRMNPLYLRDAVRSVGGGSVALHLRDAIEPVVVTAEGESLADAKTVVVVMPMRDGA